MGSKTKVIDTTPQQTQDARKKLQQQLFAPPGQTVGPHGLGGPAPAPGYVATAPEAPTATNIMTTGPVATKFNSGEDISRGQVRDVGASSVNSDKTQSVDELGGANSEFFKNMMSQLQPAFTQERSEGLAAAKESAGTLTGSGFANRLGASINRSLGSEQATLANYASQGVQTEVGRQASDAGRALTAATANQSAGLAAATANQTADQNFINQILQRNNQGLQAQQLGLQAETQNQNTQSQTNLTQAQLEAQRKLGIYNTQAGLAGQNASIYAQLLGGQATAGVTPSTVQQSGGIGSVIGSVAGTALGAFAGPVGAAAGGALGKSLFG